MSDIAALGLGVESSGLVTGEKALDSFTAAANRTGKAADDVGAATKRGGAGAETMSRSMQGAIAAANALSKAESTTAQRAMEMAEAAQRAGAAANAAAGGMNNGTGAGKMLAMQLSQVAQQGAATGQYLQALAIQLPDIAIGMSSAGAASGRFASFLAGPWGIALASAAAVLVPLIGRLFETADAADTARSALANLMQQRQRELLQQNQIATATKEVSGLIKERDMLERRQALSSRGLNQGELNRLAYLRSEIFKNRDAIDSQRLGAGSLNRVLDALANQNIKVEGATKRVTSAGARHSAGMRAAKKDADDFTLSLQAVAQALGAYQNGSLDAIKAQMDAIDAASDAAFGQRLRDDIGEAAEASTNWNEVLRETVQWLDQIGGSASGLGDVGAALVGLLSGDFSGTRGPFGALLGSLGNITWRDPIDANGNLGQIRILREEIVKGLDDVFGGEGTFAKTLTSVLQGASTGVMAGSIIGKSQANQIGGAIGGAAGKALGSAIAGPIGGMIGSVLGGIAGSALGGLFKKDKYGTTTIVGGEGYGTSGNSQKNQTGANSLADNFQSVLNNIAKTFGTTLGNFAVSIGVTNGKINVNPGRVEGMVGTTKQRDTIDFGEDQAAALKFAIRNAIEDGALEGLSEGWKKFLLNSNDIEGQLSKLSGLKSAYDELASLKDPQGFALEQLSKAFDELRATATAAGDDLAKVEELYGLKRAEIAEKYASDALDLERTRRSMEAEILRLSGDEVGALAIVRQLEREQLDPTLQGLYDTIAARQDESAAIENAAQAAQAAAEIEKARTSLRIEILDAEGRAEEALALRREQQRSATDALLQAELQQLFTAQDAATAAQNLAAAQAEAAAATDRLNQLQLRLLNAQGNDAAATALQQTLELANAQTEAERAMLALIHTAENAATAAQNLAAAQAEAAAAQAEAAAAQEEAAAKAAAQSDRILALQIRLSRAQGNEETAKAIERMQELAAAQTEEERQMLRMIHETDRLMEQQEAAAASMSSFADMIQSVADAAYKASAELRTYANQIFDEATQSDPTVLLSQIQEAMRAGNAAVLPDLIKAYLPMAENQSGSLADYQRQVAYLRQGSLYTADYVDAQANQSANRLSWFMRAERETGAGAWLPETEAGYDADRIRFDTITADKLDEVIDLLRRANDDRVAIGADQIVEMQTQTGTIDDAFNGGAGVVILEPAA